MNNSTILITGASGSIGRPLTKLLQEQGYTVSHLGRTKKNGAVKSYTWDVEKGIIDPEAIATTDHIIHLAGAPIADKRLTAARKKIVIDSRVESGRLLLAEIKKQNRRLKSFVSASAVGYYGMVTGEHIFTETDKPSTDFLGECCRAWEEAVLPVQEQGIRLAIVRVGIVLSDEGGALPQLAGPVRWLAGSPLGNGRQWLPWIHIDDICGIFLKAVQDEQMRGIYNGVAPNPVTNRELVKLIGKELHRPVFLPPVPGFVLRMLLGGEMAKMVTTGSRASCEKIKAAGYSFRYDSAAAAVHSLLGK